ncbi:MAG: alpha-hydroxy acid oxidase [Asticcacaulis sp.]
MSPKPVLHTIPTDIVAVGDYAAYARERLSDMAWEYLDSGAGDEISLRRNREAFEAILLRGRVLGSVAGGHTRLSLLGHVYEHPILLAPIAYQKLFHPDGEVASALGAAVTQTLMVLSTLSATPMETVAEAHNTALWFQLYLQKDRAVSLELIRRAERAGYRALVVTVDAAMAGVRNREQRAGFRLPDGVSAVHLEGLSAPPSVGAGQSLVFDGLMKAAPTWDDIAWVIEESRLPVVLKGVLDPDDADHACRLGAAGIVVSNHGGRVLDTLPAPIEVLPEIAAAVGGRGPVLLDGGIRRGSDVFKALALGASAVLIGRPYIQALAAAGPLGVAHAIRTLREELEIVMALSGTPTLDRISGEHIRF